MITPRAIEEMRGSVRRLYSYQGLCCVLGALTALVGFDGLGIASVEPVEGICVFTGAWVLHLSAFIAFSAFGIWREQMQDALKQSRGLR